MKLNFDNGNSQAFTANASFADAPSTKASATTVNFRTDYTDNGVKPKTGERVSVTSKVWDNPKSSATPLSYAEARSRAKFQNLGRRSSSAATISRSHSDNNWAAIICYAAIWTFVFFAAKEYGDQPVYNADARIARAICFYGGMILSIINGLCIFGYTIVGKASAGQLTKTAVMSSFMWVAWIFLLFINILSGMLAGSVYYNDERHWYRW